MLKTEFNFEEVKKALSDIPDTGNKIKYLLEVKTEYLQSPGPDFREITSFPGFAKQCQLEIEKLELLKNHKNDPPLKKIENGLGTLTQSQLVLIFYYFFKEVGCEIREEVNITTSARFLHLIMNKDLKKIQSSDYYKKLRKAPNFITDERLIEDLKVIKPLFQKVGLDGMSEVIDKEIIKARKGKKIK